MASILGLSAGNVITGDDTVPTIDLVQFGNLKYLEDLRLKSLTNSIVITDFTNSLTSFANLKSKTITKLALLSVKGMTMEQLSVIGQFTLLEHLELGSCDQFAPQDLFESFSELSSLKYLRLETGTFDQHISHLGNLEHLSQLELIDFQMVGDFNQGLINLQNIRKLLLIPEYKDEVIKVFHI